MINQLYSDTEISVIRDNVRGRLSEYRFKHTLGVEQMAIRLGEIYMPTRVSELRIAALLHDISKELDMNVQIQILDKCEKVNKKQRCVPQALHSFSAVAVILKDFPEYATEDILSAVENHTLGSPEMNLFSEIIFLSDYIEEGRPYLQSAMVRSTLFDKINRAKNFEEKVTALHFATVYSINNTLDSLSERGLLPDERSVKTKIYFEGLI